MVGFFFLNLAAWHRSPVTGHWYLCEQPFPDASVVQLETGGILKNALSYITDGRVESFSSEETYICLGRI